MAVFLHLHKGCQLASKPRSNNGYWSEKLARKREHDIVHLQALSDLGYLPAPMEWSGTNVCLAMVFQAMVASSEMLAGVPT
jgi:G:T-mismatch repair DNA endonuclease (very short patch repair protein)